MTSLEDRLPALYRLATIGLEEMDGIKLMNRVDTKFVTTEAVLADILALSVGSYRVLVTEGERISAYDTLYYDTPDRAMYLIHQNRRLVRQKIRVRTYVNSGTTYLEVKRKNNHGRTRKKRIEIPPSEFLCFAGDPAAENFIAAKSVYSADELTPSTYTRFRRITLVNNEMTERLTIDTGLTFENARSGQKADLADAVIIELKQDGLRSSPMKGILSELRVKPLRVSKYCIGTALTDPAIKKSRFLTKIRRIEKMTDKKLLKR